MKIMIYFPKYTNRNRTGHICKNEKAFLLSISKPSAKNTTDKMLCRGIDMRKLKAFKMLISGEYWGILGWRE